MKPISALAVSASLALALLSMEVAACGTCGCSLNSDWASQGYEFGAGFNLNLRFDYIDQDQLRTGRTTVDTGSIAYPTGQEIQLRTISRTYLLNLSYSPNNNWSVNALVPITDRTHSTIAEGDVFPSYSRSAGVGDVWLVGRYQGFTKDRSFGLQLGVKFPTGRFDDTFADGPQAGQTVDRGLQLGSGTTDLLAGVYKIGTMHFRWGYFISGLVQVPTDTKDGFRPGNALTVSTGIRYTGYAAFTPQLQLSLRAEDRESGINADTSNSGATLAYFSPGFTASIGRSLELFAFLQIPIYQRVNGYQLEPHYILSVGLNYRF
jgi:hypothetical protein